MFVRFIHCSPLSRRGWIAIVGRGGMLAASMSLPLGRAFADGLLVKGQLAEAFQADSNPLLLVAGQHLLLGSVTSPELFLTDSTPRFSLTDDTRVDVGEYNLSGYSSTDVHDTTAFTARQGQFSYGSSVKFDYDTTRTSELETSGINIAGIRHTGITASPQIAWAYSPALTGQLAGSFQQSDYSLTTSLTNYRVISIAPALSWIVTPNDVILSTLGGSRYQTLGRVATTTIEAWGPVVSWQHQFTERLKGSFEIGGSEISARTGGQPSTHSSDFFFDFSLNYVLSDNSSSVTLISSRNLEPSASGQELTQMRWEGDLSLTLTPALSATATISYISNDTSIGSAQLVQQSYLNAKTGLVFSVTDSISVRSTVRFEQRSLPGLSTTPVSKALLVDFIYKPLERNLGF